MRGDHALLAHASSCGGDREQTWTAKANREEAVARDSEREYRAAERRARRSRAHRRSRIAGWHLGSSSFIRTLLGGCLCDATRGRRIAPVSVTRVSYRTAPVSRRDFRHRLVPNGTSPRRLTGRTCRCRHIRVADLARDDGQVDPLVEQVRDVASAKIVWRELGDSRLEVALLHDPVDQLRGDVPIGQLPALGDAAEEATGPPRRLSHASSAA